MKIEIYFLEGKFPHCVVALDNLIISPEKICGAQLAWKQ